MSTRGNHIVRCFSLRESVEAFSDEAKDSDFQTYQTDSSDEDVAVGVADKIINTIISNDKYIYAVYDSIFKEEENVLLILFFPNITDFINEITEKILVLDQVSSAQWSKVKSSSTTDLDNDEAPEYFVVLRVRLNLVSPKELDPIKNTANSMVQPEESIPDITLPEIPSLEKAAVLSAEKVVGLEEPDAFLEIDSEIPIDDEFDMVPDVFTAAVEVARKLIEVQ